MSGVSLEQFLGGGQLAAGGGDAYPLGPAPAPVEEHGLLWPEWIEHLSATSIGMFRRCPEQFRHRYLLHEKEAPGEGLMIGSAFHGALEYNYAQKIESHIDRPTAEVVQYLQDAAVPQALEERGGPSEIVWDSGDPVKGVELMRRDSERILIRYHEDVVPRIQPMTLEEQRYLHHESLRVPLLAYVDVTTGHEVKFDNGPGGEWMPDRIVDTKTGKQSVSKLKPSWQLQATLYGALWNLPVEYHSISRAATPKITTGLESVDMVFTPNEVKTENVIKAAAGVASMIAYLYTTLGPHETWPTWGRFADWSMSFSPCSNCGWKRVCPAMHGEE